MTGGVGRVRALARDGLPVVVVAWLVFHGIRTELLERYLVPSRSMEPTLHGAEPGGDVVLVDKTAWWGWRRARPRPFELVVLHNRWNEGGNHLVKRLVALGPATVWIEDGDLFVQPDGSIGDARVVKHPLEYEDLRQTAFVLEPARSLAGIEVLRPDPERWNLTGGAVVVAPVPVEALRDAVATAPVDLGDGPLPGHLGTVRAIDSSFLDASGRRVSNGRVPVRDVGLEAVVEIAPGTAALHLVVELLGVRYGIEYPVAGGGVLRRGGEALGAPLDAPPLPIGRPVLLRFGHLDGRFFVTVDDRLAVHRAVEVPWSAAAAGTLLDPYRPIPANLLHLGVAGAPLRVTRLRGFHDVHYESEPSGNGASRGYRLDPYQIFVLGDNSFDSMDSRHRELPFELDDLVGRPVAILAPADRMRWL